MVISNLILRDLLITLVSQTVKFLDQGLKIWVYAMRNIKKGEELSYDYGFSFDKDYKQYPCKCLSSKLHWIYCKRRF